MPRWLRGRGIRLGPLHLHTTALLSGLKFIGLGIVFLVFDGTRSLTVPFPDSGEAGLQEFAAGLQLPGLLVVALACLVVVVVVLRRLARSRP
ncbi:hypothetical protein [Nonomuraea sp. B19D2]|uniref:hypothetical protein n=1 Tax=Nonomuraea sp. B19D2 TaxID=3159561 RepID=UPI0032DA4A4E